MDEQIKILGNLSTVELKTDLLKNNYLKKLELSNKLKQSILKQAFNGELVQE
jgi:restriction endonuclease S subunit